MSDELAQQDALALFRFLRRRGFIKGEPGPMPELLRDASPLTGVDMVVAETDGVVTWRVLLQYEAFPLSLHSLGSTRGSGGIGTSTR